MGGSLLFGEIKWWKEGRAHGENLGGSPHISFEGSPGGSAGLRVDMRRNKD